MHCAALDELSERVVAVGLAKWLVSCPTTVQDWLLTGWTEESAALGTAVRPPFDRWCPTTTPGAPTPSPTPPESTAVAATEAAMRSKILQISSPKNDSTTKAEIEPETAALAEFLATWNMGDYVRHYACSL